MYSHDFSNKISDFWLSVEQCFFDSTESSHFLTRRCECGGGDRGGYSTATLPSHSFLSPFRKKKFLFSSTSWQIRVIFNIYFWTNLSLLERKMIIFSLLKKATTKQKIPAARSFFLFLFFSVFSSPPQTPDFFFCECHQKSTAHLSVLFLCLLIDNVTRPSRYIFAVPYRFLCVLTKSVLFFPPSASPLFV